VKYREIMGDMVIFFMPWNLPSDDDSPSSWQAAARFIVAKWLFVCHKPDLHRPADQGLPWRCFRARLAVWRNLSTFNALTSISAGRTPLAGGLVLAQ
jgi:hypothetical protein